MNLCLKIIFINKMQTLTNMQNIFSYFNISHINNKINDYVIRFKLNMELSSGLKIEILM